MGALSELDEYLLKPQVRTLSLAVRGTSRNSGSENREPTWDRFLGDPCPKAVFSIYHSSSLNDSEQEETHHKFIRDRMLPHPATDNDKMHVRCFSRHHFHVKRRGIQVEIF